MEVAQMMNSGLIKVLILLLIESIIVYKYMGYNAAIGTISLVVICAIVVEPIMIWLDKAVCYKKLDQHTYARLSNIKDNLIKEVRRVYGKDISSLKIYVYEKDDSFACKAYGIKSIAIPRTILQLDDMTLHAVLANELAISFNVLFNRVIQVNMFIVILMIMGTSYLTIALLWIVFLVLCIFRKFSIGSYLLTNILGKALKGFFKLVEQLMMFVCGQLMKVMNHRNVYSADKFVCKLGFGSQMIYYLNRFAAEERNGTVLGIYSVNMLPNAQDRINRIKNEEMLLLQRS